MNNIDQSKFVPKNKSGVLGQANNGNKSKMALPIVLMKDGSPRTTSAIHTPKS